ncbi:NAD-dependent epimerase/dehydratase family protein [Collimonas sp. NPDC087041]|uniref:NAD-dependent epimerase/dehydratase family protein n=1 Tax=Collimonas sp. NPDC087041 TaxID=3363960 RepID=UPI003808C318
MNILVTGASGFVGRYLCQYLSSAGHEVTALVRTRGASIPGVKNELVVADFNNLEVIGDTLKDCDAVIHLAGRAHVLNDTVTDPLHEFRQVNVGMTEKLLHLAINAGVRRFVYVSSIGVNGNKNANRPFVETDVESPHDLYAISKLEAEQAVKKIAGQAGIEYVIVRPVLVFGPNAPGNFGLLLKLASRRLPLPFGSLAARRNLVSVWNLASFLGRCADYPGVLRDTFLIADKETVTLSDIFLGLGKGMSKTQMIFPVPKMFLIAICSLFGKRQLFDKLNSELRVDISKAEEKLNWTAPYTTAQALIKTGKEYILGSQ